MKYSITGLFVLTLSIMALCSGCSKADTVAYAKPYFFVDATYKGYVVEIDSKGGTCMYVSKPMDILAAKALADQLNKDLEGKFPNVNSQ